MIEGLAFVNPMELLIHLHRSNNSFNRRNMTINLKSALTLVIGLFLGSTVFSQQLTFYDLINIRQKKMEEVEKVMSDKKWKADKTESINSNELVLKNNKKNNESTQWLSVYAEKDGNVLTYQTNNKNNVEKIELELEQQGYSFVNKNLHAYQSDKVYEKDGVKVTISQIKAENTTNSVFTITVGS